MTTEQAPGRLTRAQSRQRTRDALVAAAMRVFAEDGYAGASVDRIAEQAGYTVGALYSNFGTKQELFLAAFERHCRDDLAALRGLIEATSSRQELLAAVTERFTDLDAEHARWWQLWAELWLFGQRHRDAGQRLAEVQAETRDVIADGLGGDGQRLDDELAAVVHALWSGFMLYRLTSPDAIGADSFSRAVDWLITGHATQASDRKRRSNQRPARRGRETDR